MLQSKLGKDVVYNKNQAGVYFKDLESVAIRTISDLIKSLSDEEKAQVEIIIR